MICAALPDFEVSGSIDAPLSDAAAEAIAALLLDLVDQAEDENRPADAIDPTQE